MMRGSVLGAYPNRIAAAAVLAVSVLLSGGGQAAMTGADVCRIELTDPAVPIQKAWQRHDFAGRSKFRNTVVDGVPAIEAIANGASGLYARVDADIRKFPIAEWRWRANRLQPSADLRRTESEDFSGVIFFVFGEPTAFGPDVPTLAYAWTATPGEIGSVIPNPRHPGSLFTIKLEGQAGVGAWRQERRDILADYRAVFGREPEAPLRYVALFSDNDQTGEPARTDYGAIALSACPAQP